MELSYQDFDTLDRLGGVDSLLEPLRVRRLAERMRTAMQKLQAAAGDQDPAKATDMVRWSLVRLREGELEQPGIMGRLGYDGQLLEKLAVEVGERGFVHDQKSIREALACGDMSLGQFAATDEDDRRAYNERVPLWDALNLDREDLA
jgi:hypothetical protein